MTGRQIKDCAMLCDVIFIQVSYGGHQDDVIASMDSGP